MQLVLVCHPVFDTGALPVANLLVSENKWNIPVLFGICNPGGCIDLLLISSNESCCSFPQMEGSSFSGQIIYRF